MSDFIEAEIINYAPDLIFWKDSHFVFQGCNTNFATFSGLNSPDELTGKTDFDMPWKAFAEKYQRDDKQVLAGNTVETIEHNIHNAQNIIIFVRKRLITSPSKKQYISGYAKILNNTQGDNDFLSNQIVLSNIVIKKYFFDFTPAESECMYLLLRGHSATSMATILNKSSRTIEKYIDRLKIKTNTTSKKALVQRVIQEGYAHIMPLSLTK